MGGLWDKGQRAESCLDFKEYCYAGGNTLLRWACPATCGCSMPRGGLFFNGPYSGCDREICLNNRRVKTALAAIPCEYPAPADLWEMESYHQFLDSYTYRYDYIDKEREFKDSGCAYVMRHAEKLCEDDNFQSSFVPFCPIV